jgi:hypothetical protein
MSSSFGGHADGNGRANETLERPARASADINGRCASVERGGPGRRDVTRGSPPGRPGPGDDRVASADGARLRC